MSNKKTNKESVNIDNIIENTFQHIKDIVDANIVVGTTIKVTDKLVIIPVSKISVGLVSGGGVMPKGKKSENLNAGSGTGFNVVPVGFVTINNYNFNFLPVNSSGDDLTKNMVDGVFKIYDTLLSNKRQGEDNEEKE